MEPNLSNDEMPYRLLGATGERVSLIGIGGWHLSLAHVDEELSLRIVRTALDRGVNFLDNSWDYGDGESERRSGADHLDHGAERNEPWMQTMPCQNGTTIKSRARTKREAANQLDDSLRRLKVECIDLVQHHEIIRFEDPHRIFDDEGAHAALIEARTAGKLRYIGFTGHKDPLVHLRMLDIAAEHDCRFDAVQMPLSVMDAHFRSFEKMVLPRLVAESIGVLAMKCLGNGNIMRSGTVTALECLHYAMNLPTSVVITGIDNMTYLKQAFEAARTFKQMSPSEVETILSRTAESAVRGEFEPFKVTSIYDGTAQNPKWLGEEPEKVKKMIGGA